MSKADELLHQFMQAYYEEANEDMKLIAKRIDKYLNRRDKLVVGSKWVCDVTTYAYSSKFHKHRIYVINRLDDCYVYCEDSEYFSETIILIDQFLACFSQRRDPMSNVDKEREALNLLKEEILQTHLLDENKWNEANKVISPYVNNLSSALDELDQFREKGKPKKPKYRIPDYMLAFSKQCEPLAHCPTCDWQVDWKRGCHNNKCGQRIDWSEEE